MSLLWILVALFGLASPETVTSPPLTDEAAPVAPSPDETTARANIKLIVAAIEACAAVRVDGTYRDTGSGPSMGPDCLSVAEIVETEPRLGNLDLVAPAEKPAPGQYQVMPVGDGSAGYQVTAIAEVGDSIVSYTEKHSPDGTLSKTCGTTAGDPADVIDCDDGTW